MVEASQKLLRGRRLVRVAAGVGAELVVGGDPLDTSARAQRHPAPIALCYGQPSGVGVAGDMSCDLRHLNGRGRGCGRWEVVVGALVGAVVAGIMIVSSGRVRQARTNMTTIMVKMSNPAHWFTDFGGAKTFGDSSQLLPYGIPLTIGSIFVLTGVVSNWWSF